jgi:four helix bundle protein
MKNTQRTIGFQRLRVYQVAKMALGLLVTHRGSLKGLPGELAPQLERAMLSIVANIVEGAGRVSAADQRRHYAIARGSANESAGLVEIASEVYGALPPGVGEELLELLGQVWAMLTAMAR